MSSELPGAFPSEDVIVTDTVASGLQQPTTSTSGLQQPTATGLQQPNTTRSTTTTTTTTTGAGQSTHTGAWTDPAAASTTDSPDFTESVKSFAEGAMTAAAAIGLAAKDAAIAAKDAAMPVVSDAAVAARDTAVPAANVASEKAANAAGYAKESAVDFAGTARESAANMADTAYANAPSVLPGTGNTSTSHNAHPGSIDETSTGIPTEVRDSIIKSGRGPEAAGDWQAVQDKHRMENELLHSVHKTEAGSGDNTRSSNQGTHEVGSTSGGIHEARRPAPYTQDTGSYQTPGTAVVLGTDTERAFPLGAKHDEPKHTSTSTSVPDFAETPLVTTGLETRETRETSNATGRGGYEHETGSRSHAQEVGSGYGSTERRNPTSSSGGPALADLPLREIHAPTAGVQIDGGVPTSQRETADRAPGRESTDSRGSAAYKTLSSGTPSGVQL